MTTRRVDLGWHHGDAWVKTPAREPAGTYDDPLLLDRDSLDTSGLRRHCREHHTAQATRHLPRANRDLVAWHANQHHRFHSGHIHTDAPYVIILGRDGRRPVAVQPRPRGWFTGEGTVSRSELNARMRAKIAQRHPERNTTP